MTHTRYTAIHAKFAARTKRDGLHRDSGPLRKPMIEFVQSVITGQARRSGNNKPGGTPAKARTVVWKGRTVEVYTRRGRVLDVTENFVSILETLTDADLLTLSGK